MYCNVLKIRPWAMNFSGSSKRGVGVFSRVVIFRLKIHLPHIQLVIVMYACSDSAMPLLSRTCLCNNSKWCLPSFVSPSSYIVLLLQHKWVGVLKNTLCNHFIKKRGVGLFSTVGLFSRDYGIWKIIPTCYYRNKGEVENMHRCFI